MLACELLKDRCPDMARNIDITSIAYDSRKVTDGSLFVCIKGYETDGHKYARMAADNGAALIVAEDEIDVAVPVVYVENSRRYIAELACEFYNNPSHKLSLVGITGTNGKTTITYLVKSILETAGKRVGVIGTNQNKNNRIGNYIQMKIMLIPFLVFFFICTVLPILSSVVLSFFDYDPMRGASFIGIDNYSYMLFNDDVFWAAVKNTLLFAVVTGPIGFFLSFLLAWFINEFGPKTRSVLSFLFYSPALMGNAYLIWQVLFSGDSYGYINSFLMSLNIIQEPVQWLKTPEYALAIVMVVQLWSSMGISFLANIAGLQNIDEQLYETGALDGIKSRWHELWYITLPYMQNILLFSAVMAITSSFSVGQLCMTLTGFPSVNYSTETIVTHLMDVGTMRYEMGLASAISVFLFAMMLIARMIIGKLLNSMGR